MPLHGLVGGFGHCWASHLAGMVYSNGKIDVRWRTLVDVNGGITYSQSLTLEVSRCLDGHSLGGV